MLMCVVYIVHDAVTLGLAVAQVAMMDVVSSVVAAMDAHRGVPAVAEHGLGFLRNLSVTDANKVCARLCSVDHRQGGLPMCVWRGGGVLEWLGL